jgi:hypothetical protein
MLTEIPALFGLVAILGRDTGIQLNLIAGAAAAFFVFGGLQRLDLNSCIRASRVDQRRCRCAGGRAFGRRWGL